MSTDDVAAMAASGEATRTLAERVDAIYLEHHRRVYGIALAYGGGDPAWAEDITQDVFFTLLDHLESMPETTDLRAWLRRVTINRCISVLRRKRIRESPCVRFMLGEPPSPPDPERLLGVSENLVQVWRALDGVPAKARAVFCLRYFEGESQTAIASLLRLSEGYVSKLLRRAEAEVRARTQEPTSEGSAR